MASDVAVARALGGGGRRGLRLATRQFSSAAFAFRVCLPRISRATAEFEFGSSVRSARLWEKVWATFDTKTTLKMLL